MSSERLPVFLTAGASGGRGTARGESEFAAMYVPILRHRQRWQGVVAVEKLGYFHIKA